MEVGKGEKNGVRSEEKKITGTELMMQKTSEVE